MGTPTLSQASLNLMEKEKVNTPFPLSYNPYAKSNDQVLIDYIKKKKERNKIKK